MQLSCFQGTLSINNNCKIQQPNPCTHIMYNHHIYWTPLTTAVPITQKLPYISIHIISIKLTTQQVNYSFPTQSEKCMHAGPEPAPTIFNWFCTWWWLPKSYQNLKWIKIHSECWIHIYYLHLVSFSMQIIESTLPINSKIWEHFSIGFALYGGC
jgi:hypothetical protein